MFTLRKDIFFEHSFYCPVHRSRDDIECFCYLPICHPDIIASECDRVVAHLYNVSFHTAD